MKLTENSRREFLSKAVMASSAGLASAKFGIFANGVIGKPASGTILQERVAADYTLRIGASALEIGKKQIVSAVTYDGKFPGPLLTFKEGQPVVVDVHN